MSVRFAQGFAWVPRGPTLAREKVGCVSYSLRKERCHRTGQRFDSNRDRGGRGHWPYDCLNPCRRRRAGCRFRYREQRGRRNRCAD